MLQQLQSFSLSGDKDHVKSVEKGFDTYFCSNPEPATNEALSIITSPDQPKPIRQLCANFLFAFVENRWRVPAGSASQSMRQAQIAIRGNILGAVTTSPIGDKVTMRKLCMCLAKITRYEFPGLWPNGGPFEALIGRVQQLSMSGGGDDELLPPPPSPARAQALFALHLVLKEVQPLIRNQRAASAVVEAARRARDVCRPLLGHLFGALSDPSVTSRALVDWVGIPMQPHQQLAPQHALLVLEIKILAKIMLRCCVTLDLDVDMVLTCANSIGTLAEIAAAQQLERSDRSSTSPFQGLDRDEQLDEDAVVLMERFGKVVTVAVNKSWAAMPEFALKQLAEFLFNGMKQQLSDKLFSRCANSLKVLVELGGSAGSAATQASRNVQAAVTGVLTPDGVTALVRDLITRFFRDKQSDLDGEWDADPEQYILAKDDEANSEENDDGQEEDAEIIAQHFFMSLAACEWPGIVDVIWSVLTDALSSSDASFIAGALHAVGLGYLSLGSPTQFQSFLLEKLVPALLNPDGASPLVLRRVVWVIGMWCDSLEDATIRRRLFETFGTLLQSRPHVVVALTLLRTISHLTTDCIFRPDQIAGQPLQQILTAVKEVLIRSRMPETVENLTGIIFTTTDTIVPALGDAARQMVRETAPYGVVCDSLEGFVRRAAEAKDSDNHQCAAAVMLIQALSSAFQQGLMTGEESARAVQLTLACCDKEQPITVWTEDDAWEALPGFLSSPAVPADIVAHVFRVALVAASERVFEGRKDAFLILAYATLFFPKDGSPLEKELFNAQRLGSLAMQTIRESDPDSEAPLLHNALLLLEATTRRFPSESWAQLAAAAFDDFGNCSMAFSAAVLAVALALCLEKQPSAAPISPDICARFVDKAVEAADMLPNSYAKLLLMHGLTAVCQQKLFGPAQGDQGLGKIAGETQAALGSLRDTFAGPGCETNWEDEARSHWNKSQAAAQMLLAERSTNF